MALRLGKRKKPLREEKPLKERMKIAHRVFDDATVSILLHLINKGLFDRVDYPIASGKESIVFRASSASEYYAVKVFKYETSSFRNFTQYIQGDPRFRLKHTHRELVKLWAKKEYANLQKAVDAGVSVPKPLAQRENVVVMEFLGEKGIPLPLLEEVVLEHPANVFHEVVENAKKTFQDAGLVHADLSSFNILYHQKAYLIDWGQAVLVEHPSAQQFLERDARNIAQFFKRQKINVSWTDLVRLITGK